MDTNIIYRLVFLGLGLVVIGIGAVMTYLGSYLAAQNRRNRAEEGICCCTVLFSSF